MGLKSRTIWIPGDPVAKGRPRASRRGRGVVMHTPKKTADHEKRIQAIARRAWNGEAPFDGPLLVEFLPVFGRTQAQEGKRWNPGALWHQKRPDLDNLAKVIDALNGIAFRDDGQISKIQASKVRAPRAWKEPGTVITVSQLPEHTQNDLFLWVMLERARVAKAGGFA